MSNFILTGDLGKASISGLYPLLRNVTYIQKRISKKTGKVLYRTYTEPNTFTRSSDLTALEPGSKLIRFGTRIPLTSSITYNKISAIKTSSEKFQAREILKREEVRIPFTISKEKLVETGIVSLAEYFPLIARPLTHAQGKNLYVVNSLADYKKLPQDIGYFSQFIPKDSEYRVHAAHGKILAVMQKPAPDDPSQVAWNRHQNDDADPFIPIQWREWQFDVCLQALHAIKALGLDFGAVDVISKDGVAYVLEVNTAPSLSTSPYMTNKYANYFNWLFASDNVREHFDFTQYKKVESLSWKDFDFEDRPPRPRNSRQ